MVYAISIFTHLSDDSCRRWFEALMGLLDHDGIFTFTTSGVKFENRLSAAQRQDLDQHGIVEVNVKNMEGKREFSTYHHQEYWHTLADSLGYKVLEHNPGGRVDEQDLWVIGKTAS